MILRFLQVGPLASNCYIVGDNCSKKGVVIDPGAQPQLIYNKIKQDNLKVELIILTHGHSDHIGAVNELQELTGAEVAIHEKDYPLLLSPHENLSKYMGQEITISSVDFKLKDGQKLKVGELELDIVHTPGHTPGSISIKIKNIIFTGDTLFTGSVGRTDFPGGSFQELIASIKNKLLILDDDTEIYPGHGPKSTIGIERKTNPFINN